MRLLATLVAAAAGSAIEHGSQENVIKHAQCSARNTACLALGIDEC